MDKKTAPCILNCPAHVNICKYINLIKQKKFDCAIETIYDTLPLPETLALICPRFCEISCTRRLRDSCINIAQLRIFLAQHKKKQINSAKKIKQTGKKICIIGGGPAGFCSAYFLSQFGHQIFVYDSMPQMGGMLRYGIPDYRLPKEILEREINFLYQPNINFVNNFIVDHEKFFKIKQEFDAVIISVGAWESRKIKCEGSELLIDGIKFLRDISLGFYLKHKDEIYKKKIAVIGGGSVAMDVCRSALKNGASSVTSFYRRTQNEMSAQICEIKKAREDGVIFKELLSPMKIIDNKRDKTLFMQSCELSDKSREIIFKNKITHENFDMIISAIGQKTKADFFDGETNSDSSIKVNNHFQTSIPKVFAIGDAINIGLAVNAVADAKKVSVIINKFLSGEDFSHDIKNQQDKKIINTKNNKYQYQNDLLLNSKIESEEDFLREANRCLNCGGKKNDS